jgi:succinoglycan biosynthesis transport protein ExoP
VELKQYLLLARKWWWLLALCALLGAGAAYIVSVRMTPTYEASTLLMIGGSVDVVNPTTGEMQTSEKLAQTYAELIKTRPVIEATMAALGLPAAPKVTVSLVRNTQLMRITVADSDPQRAAATADELANQLILQSPSAPQRDEQAYREFVREQLKDLEQEITALGKAIVSASEAGDREAALRYQEVLSARRTTYSSLLGYIKDSSINYIRVIEPARVPSVPVRPKVQQNTLLAGVVGLMLAAGAAFLIEYLDDTVKSQDDVEQVLSLPTLGVIAQISSNGTAPEKVVEEHPKSAFAEAYRMLRTNLRYSLPSGANRRVFLVTSVGPGEGKTTTVTNLGLVMAQAGQRVIVVDADLRRPSLHKILGCANEVGLSSLLVGEVNALEQALQPTDEANLLVLPAGPIPPNAAELLSSPRMAELVEELAARADVVLLDSPPVLAVTDASILATLASGTIMVVEVGQTHLEACLQGIEALKKVDARILGVVLNRLNLRRRGYYGNYYYYYYYRRDSAYGYGGYGEDGDGRGNGHKDKDAASAGQERKRHHHTHRQRPRES